MNRAMATAITMAGSKEGNGNGNNGVAMAMMRTMTAAMRMAGDREDEGSKGSNGQGYRDKGGGRRRGR
jgi:hypothetical protein